MPTLDEALSRVKQVQKPLDEALQEAQGFRSTEITPGQRRAHRGATTELRRGERLLKRTGMSEEFVADKEAEAPGTLATMTQPVFDALQIGQFTGAGFAKDFQKSDDLLSAFKQAASEFANALPGIDEEMAESITGRKPERPSFTDVLKDQVKDKGSVQIPLAGGVSTGITGEGLGKFIGRSLGVSKLLGKSVADPTTLFREGTKDIDVPLPEGTGLAAMGLVMDVLLDPVTYTPPGAIVKGVNILGRVGKAAAPFLKRLPGGEKAADAGTSVLETLGKGFVPDFAINKSPQEFAGKTLPDVPVPVPTEASVEGFKSARMAMDTGIEQGQVRVKDAVLEMAASMTPEERRVMGLFLDQPEVLTKALRKDTSWLDARLRTSPQERGHQAHPFVTLVAAILANRMSAIIVNGGLT